jgi:flagellin
MAFYINSNPEALSIFRYMSAANSAVLTSARRLSSGLRITSAKDDAAGLAIAARMTSQLNGFEAAIRNANDGVSLVQTADGAMATIEGMLQRMRQLAVEAANGVATASDRQALNQEAQQLISGISAIADSTSFNGLALLNGGFGVQLFQVGDRPADTIAMTIASMSPSKLGSTGTVFDAKTTGIAVSTGLSAGDLVLNGTIIGGAVAGPEAGQDVDSAYATAAAINVAQSGVLATPNGAVLKGTVPTNFGAISAGAFSINGTTFGAIAGDGTAIGQGQALASEIDSAAAVTGVHAAADATGAVTLTAVGGRNIDFGMPGVAVNAATASANKALFLAKTGFADGAVGSEATLSVAARKLIVFSGGVASGSVQINGVTLTITGTADANAAASQLLQAIQDAQTNPATAAALSTFTVSAGASPDRIEIDDLTPGNSQTFISTAAATVSTLVAGVAGNTATIGVTRGTVTLQCSDKNGIAITGRNPDAAGFGVQEVAAVVIGTVIGIDTLDLLSTANAQSAITSLDAALQSVGNARAALGAYQSRFLAEIGNLQNRIVDLSASRSRIQDADFAVEVGSLTRASIIQRASMSMLAQANANSRLVLTLLR